MGLAFDQSAARNPASRLIGWRRVALLGGNMYYGIGGTILLVLVVLFVLGRL